MASTIFVIDASMRRTTVKITPSQPLQSVLEEACRSRKLRPDEYTLKSQNGKIIDLSQPFRLSGLSAGAKLQLTQASRSAGVVSVKLQLPESEGGESLQDKFPSSTSLWVVLRKFEDGVAGGGRRRNLTQRAVPEKGVKEGAGRLMYEQPRLDIMGRVLEGFEDLQKTLAQLGFNGGSVMMRVSFRESGQGLEEAMGSIGQYFASAEGEDAVRRVEMAGHNVGGDGNEVEMKNADISVAGTEAGLEPKSDATLAPEPTAPVVENDALASSSATSPPPTLAQPPTTGSNGMSIYRPPSSGTPAAALAPHDESAFEPTIEGAKIHQASLEKRGRNTRLKSDKEMAEEAEERQARLGTVQSVVIRVQYPDQHIIELTCFASETAADLYRKVRETLRGPQEAFALRYHGATGRPESMPDSSSVRLVKDLGFRGRVKITLVASPTAGLEARKNLSLKPELLSQAQELKVELATQQAEGEQRHKEAMAKPEKQEEGKGKGKGGDVKAKMKKFLGLGRK